MIEISTDQLHNYFNEKIIVRENNKESICVFEKISAGWLSGICLTNNSAIQLLQGAKQDEHAPKYFLK